MKAALGFEVPLSLPFDEAVAHVVEALQNEGFGVLTRIDLHQAFQQKLGVDFRRYAILGACNPKLAHRALTAEPEVGLLLPCNVTVEEVPGAADRSLVRIVDAEQMLQGAGVADSDVLPAVARDAAERLRRVARALAA